MTAVSAAACGIFSSRPSSLSAFSSTSSGMPAAWIFSLYSSISAWISSYWPSSCWIALSCSRRKYSRWVLVIDSLTRFWILLPSSRISSSLRRNPAAFSMRSFGSSGLEDRLLLLHLEVQVERDEVGEPARLLDAHRGDEHFLRNGLAELGRLLEVGDQVAHERLGLDVDLGDLRDELDADLEVRVLLDELEDSHALLAFDERLRGAVRQLQLLQHGRHAADLVEVVAHRVLRVGLALCHQRDEVVLAHGLLEGGYRPLPADEERHDEVREEDEVPQRDEREDVRNVLNRRVVGHGTVPSGDCGILT